MKKAKVNEAAEQDKEIERSIDLLPAAAVKSLSQVQKEKTAVKATHDDEMDE